MSDRMPGSCDNPHSASDLFVALDLTILGVGEVDPLRHRVHRLVRRLVLGALHVDRDSGEQQIVATVIEVQMRAHDCAYVVWAMLMLLERNLDRPVNNLVVAVEGVVAPADARVKEDDAARMPNSERENVAG